MIKKRLFIVITGRNFANKTQKIAAYQCAECKGFCITSTFAKEEKKQTLGIFLANIYEEIERIKKDSYRW